MGNDAKAEDAAERSGNSIVQRPSVYGDGANSDLMLS